MRERKGVDKGIKVYEEGTGKSGEKETVFSLY